MKKRRQDSNEYRGRLMNAGSKIQVAETILSMLLENHYPEEMVLDAAIQLEGALAELKPMLDDGEKNTQHH